MPTKTKVEIKTIQQSEISEAVRKLQIVHNGSNFAYRNFHYFTRDTVSFLSFYADDNQQPPIYFFAYSGKTIVGVLKLGHYVRETYDYWAVNYVDVHTSHKRQGIATALYEQLNEWCKGKDIIIFGTHASGEGVAANIHGLRKRLVTNVPNYNSTREYFEATSKE